MAPCNRLSHNAHTQTLHRPITYTCMQPQNPPHNIHLTYTETRFNTKLNPPFVDIINEIKT